MRFRNVFLVVGSILTFILLLLSDPDSNLVQKLPFGIGILSLIIILTTSIFYVGYLHLSRKALFDYLDLQKLFNKASLTPEGAGLALIAVSLAMISISIVILAATASK